MGELKTKANDSSVQEFLDAIADDQKQQDSFDLLTLFSKVTNEAPRMWGDSIVGFGQYHYKSERSSQEGDWPLTGFSPRKQNLTIYIMNGFDRYQDLLATLGKHKTSVGCLYIKKLQDIDRDVLREILERSFHDMKKQYRVNQ